MVVFLFLYQLCNTADSDIDLRDLIPGRIVDDACGGQTEHRLELPHGIAGGRTKDTVSGDRGNGRIVLVDAV